MEHYSKFLKQAKSLMRRYPMIDAHNDLPHQIRELAQLNLDKLNPNERLTNTHTDLPRMREGLVSGQFWIAYPDSDLPAQTALIHTLEAIDLIHRMIANTQGEMKLALTADDILPIFKSGSIIAMIGAEGGQAICHSLGILRDFYRLGVRYMTLTHNTTTDWADSATDIARHDGLSPFGLEVLQEMNRLGMMIDLSHTSPKVMLDALAHTKAPLLFTHANAYALAQHPRNIPDDILEKIPANGGLAMITFVPGFSTHQAARWRLAKEELEAELATDNELTEHDKTATMKSWFARNPMPEVTVRHIADHFDYFVHKVGIDHVGFGSDFDGIADVPEGLEDVSCYPNLLAELLRRGYTEAELSKAMSGNLIRVMRENEEIAQKLQTQTSHSQPCQP